MKKTKRTSYIDMDRPKEFSDAPREYLIDIQKGSEADYFLISLPHEAGKGFRDLFFSTERHWNIRRMLWEIYVSYRTTLIIKEFASKFLVPLTPQAEETVQKIINQGPPRFSTSEISKESEDFLLSDPSRINQRYSTQFYEATQTQTPQVSLKSKPKNSTKANRIAQCDLVTGNILKIWDSQNQASKETGINQATISQCLNGKYKTAGGFVWKRV